MRHKFAECLTALALSAATVFTPLTLPASAAVVGEVVNHTLYTDIVAYIDGQPIESYNINGRTAVVAEQLLGYGFDVKWNGEERSLSVTEGSGEVEKRDVTVFKIPEGMVGRNKSEVYYTDIKAYVNGALVESYNVGGSTIIIFDCLSAFGDISWNADEREISFKRRMSEDEYADEVIRLLNIERESFGLSPLKKNDALMKATAVRAEEISRDGHFSHTRPDGGSCFSVLAEFDVIYTGAGENIAMGYGTPASVMDGWMNSEGHRANILGSHYTDVGVGVYRKDGRLYWVQLFAKTKLSEGENVIHMGDSR